MIGPAPADRPFRPTHELWVAGGDCVDLLVLSAPAALVLNLAREDEVGGVLIWELILNGPNCWSSSRRLGGWRRWAGRRRRHQPLALGDPREPMTLPGRVVGRLRAAVELAGSIKSLLVGESRLPSRPAALLLLGRGCNTPDVTSHICNSNPCHFRLCVMIFSPWSGFVFLLHFVQVMHLISCHHVHLICIRVRLMHPSIFPIVRFAIRHSHVHRHTPLVSFREQVLNVIGMD